MESNKESSVMKEQETITDDHQDKSVEKVLNKKDLNQMVWRSLLLQSSFNYERMQGGGWTYSIIPGLKKSIRIRKTCLMPCLTITNFSIPIPS